LELFKAAVGLCRQHIPPARALRDTVLQLHEEMAQYVLSATHTVNAAAMQRNALAFQALRFRSGLTIDELPMDAWAGLMAAATPVFDGIADRDAEGKRVVRAYRRFASAVQNWTMVADGAFTLARARSI
ncbi:MAG: hypothetical protein AAGJ92_10670, partial [Pseudomonadota bacterium]